MKDLINKYKIEFDYWCTGGRLQAKFDWWWTEEDSQKEDGTDLFEFALKNNLTLDQVIFVIDDNYVELRKALAEGKTIQLNEAEKFSDSNRGWSDLSCTSLGYSKDLFPVDYYRIKPEEPKFRVGDYIRRSGYDVNIGQIKEICKDENEEVIGFFTEKYFFTKEQSKLWVPKENEWCLFKKNNSIYALAQFEAGDIYNSNSAIKSVQCGFDGSQYWDSCKPFIGKLPGGCE